MPLSQAYKSINDVVIGQRIMYDNTSGYVSELPRIKMVGEILDLDKDKQTIAVEFKIRGFEPKVIDLPYFLAQ